MISSQLHPIIRHPSRDLPSPSLYICGQVSLQFIALMCIGSSHHLLCFVVFLLNAGGLASCSQATTGAKRSGIWIRVFLVTRILVHCYEIKNLWKSLCTCCYTIGSCYEKKADLGQTGKSHTSLFSITEQWIQIGRASPTEPHLSFTPLPTWKHYCTAIMQLSASPQTSITPSTPP